MQLYYMDASAPCRAVMLTARAVGHPVTKIPVDMSKNDHLKPDFVALNPQHCIPTIIDGDLTLWESRAICTYITTKYGKDDSLYPNDPNKRALVDRLLYFDIGTLYQRFADYAYPVTFYGAKEVFPERLVSVHEALNWLDGFLKQTTFATANHITVADHCLVASVTSIRDSGINISKYSNICSWITRCEQQMPGFEEEITIGSKKLGEMIREKIPPA